MVWAVNLDMVGGDSTQTSGHLWLDQTPWSMPTYLNDLMATLMSETATTAPEGWQYGVREHMGGSDHIMFLAPEIGVPAIMLGHEPDLFYHSNLDTVDKTSPREFEKVAQVVVTGLLLTDRITPERACAFAHLVYQGAMKRIIDYGERTIHRVLTGPGKTTGDYRTQMHNLLAKEQAALDSIVTHCDDQSQQVARTETEFLRARLADACDLQIGVMDKSLEEVQTVTPHNSRDEQVPQRLFSGPISSHLMGLSLFLESLGPRALFYRSKSLEDRTFVCWMSEASNLIDGRRTIRQIQDILLAEYAEDAATMDDLCQFVDDMVIAGMAALI